MSIRRSGLECRETLDPPVVPHGDLDSMGRPRAFSDEGTSVSRERAMCGYTQVVRVADVDRTHRASCMLGGRKASSQRRALAGRKLQAPPDAEHEQRDGETVRGFSSGSNQIRPRATAHSGFGPGALDTTEGVLGCRPSCFYRQGEARSSDPRVNTVASSARSMRAGQRIGRSGNRLGRARG